MISRSWPSIRSQPDPAVAADQLAEVGRQVGGKRELANRSPAPAIIASADMPGGRGVPERERRQAVGVDVLGALLQLGERRDRVAGLGVQRVVDFQQDRAVALHDQRIGGVVLHGLLAGSKAKRESRISMVRSPLSVKRERSMLDSWRGRHGKGRYTHRKGCFLFEWS